MKNISKSRLNKAKHTNHEAKHVYYFSYMCVCVYVCVLKIK